MTPDSAAECKQALARGEELLHSEGGADEYVLVAAERRLAQPGSWRLTYKPRRLVPERSDEPIGAGGELFAVVDLATGDARVTGRGE